MAKLIKKENGKIEVSVEIDLSGGTMLDMEDEIQKAVNEVGNTATKEALSKFDASGLPIRIGDVKMTSKGKTAKEYETPYGTVECERHVYQSSGGGRVYCPLDDRARIIISSTPKFAQMISYKYASTSAAEVEEDLHQNHNRKVTRGFIQKMGDMLGFIVLAAEKKWQYDIPDTEEEVRIISVSLDGTCIAIVDEGYKEAMVGNISLYNAAGERWHSIYIGAAPEEGKKSFLARLQVEVEAIKKKYPKAKYIGIADGAQVNWDFLNMNTQHQILDFYHAAEYVSTASHAIASNESNRQVWLRDARHKLKHDTGGADDILAEMIASRTKKLSKSVREDLERAITYFSNQKHRMNYADYCKRNFPIGSGVTEASCKTIVKQRLCRAGMKWKHTGAKIIIALRALIKTPERWAQLWYAINRNGFADLMTPQ